MNIIIRQPLSFSEIGRKDNQEDYVCPDPQSVGTGQRFFILCDGMGGHEHGEVASSTVAEALGEYLGKITKTIVSTEDFNAALSYAYDQLDSKDTDDGGKKMGTTMTCVFLHEGGALVAHIGDSRVYHINNKTGVRHVTSDHSLVNDLLKAGELTEEEARNYPHKNIITRAIQPHQDRRVKAEISLITDIEAGDYFFMCCDGVLEQLTNDRLCEILSDSKLNDQGKLDAIKAECDGKTKDNYTCWLIPVSDVKKDESDLVVDDEDVIQAVSVDTEDHSSDIIVQEESSQIQPTDNIRRKPLKRFLKPLIVILFSVILICACAYAVWLYLGKDTKEAKPDIEQLDK